MNLSLCNYATMGISTNEHIQTTIESIWKTFASLDNKVVMTVRETIVTQGADRGLRLLISGSSNFPGR
jgi:hypothetical protein